MIKFMSCRFCPPVMCILLSFLLIGLSIACPYKLEIEDEGEKNELISPDVYIWIRQTMLEDFLTFDSSMFAQSISEEMQANMRCSCNSAWDHTWSSLLFLMSLTLVELEEDVRCQYQWEIEPQS